MLKLFGDFAFLYALKYLILSLFQASAIREGSSSLGLWAAMWAVAGFIVSAFAGIPLFMHASIQEQKVANVCRNRNFLVPYLRTFPRFIEFASFASESVGQSPKEALARVRIPAPSCVNAHSIAGG